MAGENPKVGSPDWWVQRLFEELNRRQDAIALFDDYYSGNHPLPWLPKEARDDFRRLLKMTRSNYMGLVVDAMVERMTIEGFRVGDADEADVETWALWQRNNMDAEYSKALLESAICGSSYLLVTPPHDGDDDDFSHIYVEHASQCIVAYEPGSNRRRRAAGLKAWTDEWTGDIFATLYLPDKIYKYRAENKDIPRVIDGHRVVRMATAYNWIARDGASSAVEDGSVGNVIPNPLGEVPLFEQPNNPRLLTGGVSELVDLVDIQDRINKTIADRLITQDFGAFPQKWATGLPTEDEDGNAAEPLQIGRDRLITTDVIEANFGQFQGTSLDPYSVAKREDVKDVASRSRTPAQYLLGEMSNVNAETLKASESGLVSKVRQRMRGHSDPTEDAVRLLRKAAGMKDSKGQDAMETLWKNPEFRTEGELVDSLVKLSQINVPDRGLWEIYGATPRQIERWIQQQEEQAKRSDILALMSAKFRGQQMLADQQAELAEEAAEANAKRAEVTQQRAADQQLALVKEQGKQAAASAGRSSSDRGGGRRGGGQPRGRGGVGSGVGIPGIDGRKGRDVDGDGIVNEPPGRK